MTTLLCNECGKSFTDEPLLYIHQTRQPDKTSHSCGECSTEVIGKMALKNHKRRHKMPAVKNLERKHKARKGICLRGVPIYYNDKGLSEGPHKEDACCQRCGLDVCGGSLRKKNQRLSWTIGCFFSIKKIIKTFRVKFDLRLSLPRGAWIVTESRYTSLSSKMLTKTPRTLFKLIQLILKNWWICAHSIWRGHLSFL